MTYIGLHRCNVSGRRGSMATVRIDYTLLPSAVVGAVRPIAQLKKLNFAGAKEREDKRSTGQSFATANPKGSPRVLVKSCLTKAVGDTARNQSPSKHAAIATYISLQDHWGAADDNKVKFPVSRRKIAMLKCFVTKKVEQTIVLSVGSVDQTSMKM